ncbi:MAG: aminopeptidase P family protein [Candidatus Omnitrophica bacterium]|nr:aminopeptidase P family protein [Candidatus Omnitrophota bacterium]
MNDRIDLILKELIKENLDGVLITKEQNVFYLSGFKGSESRLFLTHKDKFFLTDFRYILQAKKELNGFKIIQTKGTFSRDISDLCNELRIKRLGFEAGNLPYREYIMLRRFIKKPRLIPTVNLVENFRKIKTAKEIGIIKRTVRIAITCLDFIKRNLCPGISEKDFAAKIDYFIKTNGGDDCAFKTIVASSSNSVIPHSIVTKRVMKKKDLVLIDFGVKFSGYNSDLTRVFSLGKINFYYKKFYSIITKAQEIAIDQIRPGVRISDIELRVRNFLKGEGLEKFFGHSLGHGIGIEVHEAPKISKDNKDCLEENMVFTIEPGIYIPNLAGFRKEDMVVVTKTGCEVLTDDFNR